MQSAPILLFLNTAPLLEKEGHISRMALLEEIVDPSFLHGSSTPPALAPDYNPIDI